MNILLHHLAASWVTFLAISAAAVIEHLPCHNNSCKSESKKLQPESSNIVCRFIHVRWSDAVFFFGSLTIWEGLQEGEEEEEEGCVSYRLSLAFWVLCQVQCCSSIKRRFIGLLTWLEWAANHENPVPRHPPNRVARLSLLFVTTFVTFIRYFVFVGFCFDRPSPIHNNSEMGVTRGCKSVWVNLSLQGEDGGMQMNYDRCDFFKPPSKKKNKVKERPRQLHENFRL